MRKKDSDPEPCQWDRCLACFQQDKLLKIKDGAYFCYCAYVLRISRYLGFLSLGGTY